MSRKNPVARRSYAIYAVRAPGPRMWFDGRKFTNNGKPWVFAFKALAVDTAQKIVDTQPILKGYRVTVEHYTETRHAGRKTNPDNRHVAEAARRFEEFSGHPAEVAKRVKIPTPRALLAIGELDGLLYTTIRDAKRESYIHEFRKRSRPLLAASSDGRQLQILGGEFEFTEAGIEDR